MYIGLGPGRADPACVFKRTVPRIPGEIYSRSMCLGLGKGTKQRSQGMVLAQAMPPGSEKSDHRCSQKTALYPLYLALQRYALRPAGTGLLSSLTALFLFFVMLFAWSVFVSLHACLFRTNPSLRFQRAPLYPGHFPLTAFQAEGRAKVSLSPIWSSLLGITSILPFISLQEYITFVMNSYKFTPAGRK